MYKANFLILLVLLGLFISCVPSTNEETNIQETSSPNARENTQSESISVTEDLKTEESQAVSIAYREFDDLEDDAIDNSNSLPDFDASNYSSTDITNIKMELFQEGSDYYYDIILKMKDLPELIPFSFPHIEVGKTEYIWMFTIHYDKGFSLYIRKPKTGLYDQLQVNDIFLRLDGNRYPFLNISNFTIEVESKNSAIYVYRMPIPTSSKEKALEIFNSPISVLTGFNGEESVDGSTISIQDYFPGPTRDDTQP